MTDLKPKNGIESFHNPWHIHIYYFFSEIMIIDTVELYILILSYLLFSFLFSSWVKCTLTVVWYTIFITKDETPT